MGQPIGVRARQLDYQSTNLTMYRINALSIYRSINLMDNEGSLLRSDAPPTDARPTVTKIPANHTRPKTDARPNEPYDAYDSYDPG